jgi:hypothetical protein
MSPADIAAAQLSAGLALRLAELGLIPPDPAIYGVPAPEPVAPVDEARKDGVSAVAGGGIEEAGPRARTKPPPSTAPLTSTAAPPEHASRWPDAAALPVVLPGRRAVTQA